MNSKFEIKSHDGPGRIGKLGVNRLPPPPVAHWGPRGDPCCPRGERRRDGMSELSPPGGSEGYGVRADEADAQRRRGLPLAGGAGGSV